ncbi:uncharacterized protein LOC126035494 [Accipiter gentilis]|uniref:uncharacterized protein LOC126035494 n=1 Tax=Astur gentilis TaxID=8957 RepID=UPI00210F4520|nr:uncharacterized protein LOC126035494 [Accipiter gentilis]
MRWENLKRNLVEAPVLILPDIRKPFQLFINVDNGTAYGVLTQGWAGQKKPVGYYSRILDPVSHGWPTCLQAIVATALLVEEVGKVTLGSDLKVYTPHNIREVLQQRADKWLTDSRLLKYEGILINSPKLEMETTSIQNPAQFLYGEPREDLTHDCLQLINLQTKIREDLEEEELDEGEKLFVDGSSRVVEGQRKSGYAIVDGFCRLKEAWRPGSGTARRPTPGRSVHQLADTNVVDGKWRLLDIIYQKDTRP